MANEKIGYFQNSTDKDASRSQGGGQMKRARILLADDQILLTEALTKLLEPMLMVFLGVVIGGMVVAMYLPIFKIAGAIE